MIDQALGWDNPVARRRRQVNTSQNSSKNNPEPIKQSTNRNMVNRLSNQESVAKSEEFHGINGKLDSSIRSRPKNEPKQQPKIKETPSFQEQIRSPGLRNKNQAKVIKTSEMQNSSRLLTTFSIQLAEQEKKNKAEVEQRNYKIKIIIFLIISMFVMFEAMSLSRKGNDKIYVMSMNKQSRNNIKIIIQQQQVQLRQDTNKRYHNTLINQFIERQSQQILDIIFKM